MLNATVDYQIKDQLCGFSELSNWIELDDKIKPLQDRLVFTQGLKYNTPWGFGVQGGFTFRFNQKRTDGTQTRAENWRFFAGIALNTQTFHPDDDQDGVANANDLELNTPAGYPVDSKGRALDSDDDGVVDGMDQEKNTPQGAVVDRFGKSIDSDSDGVPDGIDRQPNTPTGAVVGVFGVAIDSDGDSVPDGIDEEPNTPPGASVDLKGRALPPMEVELVSKGLLRVHQIYFDIGKSTIKPESFAVLREIGRILQRHPELKVQINGHTDATGSDEMNLRLSIERAERVREHLLQQIPDIVDENITTKGFGRSKPLSSISNEEAKTQNRRVEFEVLNLEEIKNRQK